MKKISIILLALLMLLAFVSCDKDKSGDMINTYEEFVKAYNNCLEIPTYFAKDGKIEASDIDNWELRMLVHTLNGSYIGVTSLEVADGSSTTLTTSEDKNTKTYTFNNISITYKYTEGEEDTTEKDGTYTLTGTYVVTDSADKGSSYSFDITINSETKCKIAYSKDANGAFTSASVNGTDVELRLLNKQSSIY